MTSRAALLTLPAMALLAGCSTVEGWFGHEPPRPQPVAMPAPPPPPPPSAPVSMAPPELAGHYAGALRLAHGAPRGCRPASIPASATVANGQVAFNFGRHGSAEGPIIADSVAKLTGTEMAGQASFAGRQLTGEVQRGTCPYELRLTKRR